MGTYWLQYIIVLSVGLQALNDTNAKIIRNEVNVCEDDEASLTCGGNNSVQQRWKISIDNGRRQKITIDGTKYVLNNSSALVVKNVNQADTRKQYYCHTESPTHHFRITYIYTLKIVCKDMVANVGDQISMYCNVGIADADIDKIDWRFRPKHVGRANKVISNGRIMLTGPNGRTLNISVVKKEDCGTFTCIASRKKDLHLGRERFFYNTVVEDAPTLTSIPSTKVPSTVRQTTQMPVKPTSAGKYSTAMELSTQKHTSKMPVTTTFTGKDSTFTGTRFPTRKTTSKKEVLSTLKATEQTGPLPTKNVIKSVNSEKFKRTLSTSYFTTASMNAVQQVAKDAPTVESLAVDVNADIKMIGFSLLVLCLLFFQGT